jgi:hypothetical protein
MLTPAGYFSSLPQPQQRHSNDVAVSSATASPVDLVALATTQASCTDCQQACMSSSLRLSHVHLHDTPVHFPASFHALSLMPFMVWHI